MYENMDIEKIVEKAKCGDEDAFKEIFKKYELFVYKQCRKFFIHGFEFEDLVQHSYLSIIKAVNMYDLQRGNFGSYVMMSIANNLAYLLRGEIKHYREVTDECDFERLRDEYEFTIEDQMIAYEQVKELYDALDELKDGERKGIVEFYLEGKALGYLAKEMGVSYGGASKMKDRALVKLRRCLKG